MGKGKDDKGIKKPDPRQPGAAPPASSTARPGASSSSQTPRPSANPSQARPKSGEFYFFAGGAYETTLNIHNDIVF